MVYGFSPASEAELKALTLFELGYPLGAHIDVLQRGDALDITDACVTKTVFAFDGDHEQMHRGGRGDAFSADAARADALSDKRG